MERSEQRQGGLSEVVRSAVASHLDDLLARGFTWTTIEEAAGLARSTGRKAMKRPNPRLATLEALWGVTPDEIFRSAPDGAWVPSIGTQRRLLALRASGHVLEDLFGKNAWKEMHARQHLYAATHREVASTYEELKDKDGPSQQNKTLARHQGWPPPAAWAGIDMDDPHSVPNPLEIPLTWDETVDSIRDILACGKSAEEVCNIVGKKQSLLSRKLYATGHPDLGRLIARKQH